MNNIITAVFGANRVARTRELWKIDHGMKLQIVGLDLPLTYQVHFANSPNVGEASVVVAESDIVDIPDAYFLTGENVYAWVYLTPESGVGYTVYMITIPVKARPLISEYEPTPVQQNAIDEAIGALNHAVEITNQDVIDATAAKDASEAAQEAAEAAQSASQAAANTATAQAQNAAGSASDASDSATAAQTAQGLAENARDAAAVSANRAEQAANKAGYMDFEINNNGHLIYTRTDAVDVNFILDDGHLYMEVV